jgi:uncharacterized membrane protein YeaQ/YmgE (transglycosylase-associated protein family)
MFASSAAQLGHTLADELQTTSCPAVPGLAGRAGGYRTRVLEHNGGIMGIIAFLVLGLLAGAIAKAIFPGDDPGGLIVTMIIGVVGALAGGFLAAALFGAHPLDDFFDISTWVTAIVGSLILLGIYRLVVGQSGTRHSRLT